MEAAIKKLVINKNILRATAVGVFVILTTLSTFLRLPLPFTPVPLTLQTFFVLLSGALLGRKLGVFTQVTYMLLGLTGQQVFTGSGSGSLYLLGPTGGYIVGFILAAFFAGNLFNRSCAESKFNIFLKLLLVDFLILLTGTLWLKLSLSCTLSEAFLLGFLPFVLGDVFKVILATIAYSKMHSRFKTALY